MPSGTDVPISTRDSIVASFILLVDLMKALLCYSYDSYRKASGGNPKGYRELILDKYPNDEEVKILLS